ncbi:MAG TPA: serine/threonine-protein kinase [Verrucomicrobiae bacterium]|nr:serine/threonine-protein kinase [Verrucomicrobiae bacterium]
MPELDEEAVFSAACELTDPVAVAAFLEKVCAGNVELRQRVQRLLNLQRSARGFFENTSEAVAAAVRNPDLTDPVSLRFGDYELLEEIARGGMGVVYKARHVSLDRLVAVKMLLFSSLASKEFIQRFRVEASAAASLRHPNIVAVHEVGVQQDKHYLVMDYIAGPTLAKLTASQPIPAKRAAAYVKTLAQAIHFAHEHGVLHRDLKPSNVLVDFEDQPHVTDFGMAKRQNIDSSLTLTGQLLGTPSYMAPELASGRRGAAGRPTDVYSLGAILFYLLTGRPPFIAETITDTIQMVLEKEPITPGALVLGIPKDLETICLKCLRKEPERRYGTAQELADELGRFLSGEPIRARRAGYIEKVWRWCRRRPAVASFAVTSAALAVAILIGSPIAMYKIEKARQSEVSARIQADNSLYIAKMNLAQREWDRNNLLRVEQLLKETENNPRRGFEWYYWQRRTHGDVKTLRGHTEPIWSVAYSPDGQRVVTGSADRTAKVWDTATGKEVVSLTGHQDAITSVAYSTDGHRIITGSADETARVWDSVSGKELLVLRGMGHRRDFLYVAFSPDGRRILTACQYATLWDAATGQPLITFKGHKRSVRGVAFSPDGRLIVTGSYDKTYKIWDISSGKELFTLAGHADELASAAFSPHGERVVTGGSDGIARVWGVATGEQLFTLGGHGNDFVPVAFSPDGKRIATSSGNGSTTFWDAATGKELFTLKGHTTGVISLAYSPDGKSIVTACGKGPLKENTAKICQAAPDSEALILDTHKDKVNSVAFSTDGKRIVTGSDDGTAKVWDGTTGAELFTLAGHTNRVMGVAISHDGKRIATASYDYTARIWDPATGQPLKIVPCGQSWVNALAFSPDDRRIVTACADGSTTLWESSTGGKLLSFSGQSNGLYTVAFSPNGRWILTGDQRGIATIWDASSGEQLHSVKAQDLWIVSAVFSPDSKRFIVGGEDRMAKVWDVATGNLVLTLRGQSDQVWAVDYSRDGHRIATGGRDGIVKVWDADNGEELLALTGHTKEVRSIAFSPDGTQLVSGSWDSSARIWRGATAQEMAAWDFEEKAAEEHLELERRRQAEAVERERIIRMQDTGAIRRWLALAPIHFETNGGPDCVSREEIPNEADLRPHEGEETRVGTNVLVWSAVRLPDYLLDLKKAKGKQQEFSLGYAVSYIESQSDQTNLCLFIGNDDECRLYLNGSKVFQQNDPGTYFPDSEVVTNLALKRGLNVLVAKLVDDVNGFNEWRISVRFADAEGRQVSGIKLTLDPEGKDVRP